jgi:hypothetical protein
MKSGQRQNKELMTGIIDVRHSARRQQHDAQHTDNDQPGFSLEYKNENIAN